MPQVHTLQKTPLQDTKGPLKGNRHFHEHFLSRLIDDMSSTESLVSCPECMDDLDANTSYPVIQCNPDVNRRRSEYGTDLYISSRMKNSVVSFLRDI